MTGFASVTREDERATIAVTIRALNHRYLDLQLRIPQSLAAIEADVRALVGKRVARGRVELSLSLQLRQTRRRRRRVQRGVRPRRSRAALDQARARGLVAGALTPGDLLRLPQALTIRERQTDADDAAQAELGGAGARGRRRRRSSISTRCASREGDHLRADLDSGATFVADLVERDRGRRRRRARGDGAAARASACASCATELQADETAVAQEIVRMAGAVRHQRGGRRGSAATCRTGSTLADSAEPCGRKLDFLLQEMNREVNTMGSKADGLRVSELIIAAKAELEKMREQVQNVE